MRCMLLSAVLLLSTRVVQSGENATTYANGCVLERSGIVNIGHDPFSDMPRPFLNCSGLGKSSFNLSQFPSDIQSIKLAGNLLVKFSARDLSLFKDLKKLDLAHNSISTLEPLSKADNVSFERFQALGLGHNKLTEVPGDFLKNFSDLWALDISGNRISEIKDGDFDAVPDLKLLAAGSNPLKQISDGAFSNLKDSLMGLALPFSGLTEIPSFVRDMTKLAYFSLANNNVSNVQRTAFEGTKSLRWLELASNRIQRIDGLAFANCRQLRLLDFTDNMLETLPPGVFDSMTDQQYFTVEMYENPFRCNCSLRWIKMWMDKLHYKDIRFKCSQPLRNHGKKSYEMKLSDYSCDADDQDWAENSQQSCEKPTRPTVNSTRPGPPPKESSLCPKNCTCYNSKGEKYSGPTSTTTKSSKKRRFWWLGSLKYPHVDCSALNLTKLPTGIRRDVKTLTLENNKIATLSIADLKPFASLEMLELESSGLAVLNPDVTTIFKNLTDLSLHRNNLTAITSEHLKSFPGLKVLRMFDNKIKTIPRNIFNFNRALTRLYIGPNPIRNFDPKCLDGLKLYSLKLQNMSLRAIPKIVSKNLTYYDLRDNYITTIPDNAFVSSPNIIRMTLDNNRIGTIAPNAFNQCTGLRSLDLSENKISTLPPGVFDSLYKERLHIELWSNMISCDCNMRWLKQWIEKLDVTSPMTEIRFMCSYPLRLHGKISENLSPADFTCASGDTKATVDTDILEIDCEFCYYRRGRCFSSGQLGAAIVLTMLFTILACLAVRCCCNRRRGGYARYKPQDDTTVLDVDM